MLQIGVQSTVDRLIASLDAFSPDQFPFTVAKALTKTAQDAQAAVREAMPVEFILRRDWIVKGIRIEPARKDHLVALVYSKDPFMGRQEYGGEKMPKLGGRYIAIPMKGARPSDRDLIPTELLPQNMPRGLYRTSRRTGLPHASNQGPHGAAFIMRATDGRMYLVRRLGKTLQFLYRLEDAAEVRPRLNMREITLRVVHQRFARNLMVAAREAMATRRAGGALSDVEA